MTVDQVLAFTVSDTKLLAGIKDEGVFLTTNNGVNWIEINEGLLATDVRSLGISDTNLFAGTREGVWRRTLYEIIVSAEELPNHLPSSFSLFQNYPNPFNPSTKIRFTIPNVIASGAMQSQLVILKVYDVLGNEIETLVNEEKPAGTSEIEFDSHSGSVRILPSGVYFYRLTAGDFIMTKKMILLR